MNRKRKHSPIEKNIRPLVDWLNHISIVKTHFSCHGHIGMPEAWVIFSAKDLEFPYSLWDRLKSVSYETTHCGLKYSWTIKPWFAIIEKRPAFIMVGTPIGRLGSLMRKRLPEEIVKLDKLFMLEKKEGNQKNNPKTEGYNPGMSVQPTSSRIFSLADGTSMGIASNQISATVTFNELCHEVMYHALREKSKIKHKKRTLIICSPLNHAIALWKVKDLLDRLRIEGAYKGSIISDGYFTAEKEVLLILTYG